MAAEPVLSRWRAEPYDYAEARALVGALGLSEAVAVTLVRRGYRTVDEAAAFLEASETHDPFAFAAMRESAERILERCAGGGRITVHGDYDVDGVCATAILVTVLRRLGASCDWHLPSRFDDGYGVSLATVERLAARGTEMLITVDCGITAVEEVDAAVAAGLEVLVTDHHRPAERLPECPILHPVLSGYPCEELCATGIAYKLSEALCQLGGLDPGLAETQLDLVALATVADLVPLRGENRSLVRRGLSVARRSARPGLRALAAVAATELSRLDEQALAFRLAPRINAAGRLHRADAGLELLLTADEPRAREIALELDRANRERQEIETRILWAAEAARSALPGRLADAPALVLAGEGWHPGVIGIVASRLVERFNRPTVLVALGEPGSGRGSGRSIPAFDLLQGLGACSEHLIRYGGHRAAAGLEIAAERVEGFREAFVAHAESVLRPEDLVRVQPVDALVGGEQLGLGLAEELERLSPFGMGNRGVSLLVPAATVDDVRPMGEGKHVRFSLRTGGSRAAGVGFGTGGTLPAGPDEPHDAAVRLEANEWNGAVEPRVVLKQLYPVGGRLACPAACADCPDRALGAEWWSRVDAERAAALVDWPPAAALARLKAGGAARRELVDRRGASAVAAIAELLSSGEGVLALCADVSRRRGLAEEAAEPARVGSGRAVLASGRCAAREMRGRLTQADGPGLVLADYSTLAREGVGADHEHVVLVDPPPFAYLRSLAESGRGAPWAAGFLHLAWGEAELELAIRAHRFDYGLRGALEEIYRALRASPEPAGRRLIALLAGEGRHPRTPEQAGRCLRVLEELGLVAEEENEGERTLRVVSSAKTDLAASPAYRAYEARLEEGNRYLSQQTAGSPSR